MQFVCPSPGHIYRFQYSRSSARLLQRTHLPVNSHRGLVSDHYTNTPESKLSYSIVLHSFVGIQDSRIIGAIGMPQYIVDAEQLSREETTDGQFDLRENVQ